MRVQTVRRRTVVGRFQLEKILQACEIADASEPYANCAARDERTKEKLSAAAADFCERLGELKLNIAMK